MAMTMPGQAVPTPGPIPEVSGKYKTTGMLRMQMMPYWYTGLQNIILKERLYSGYDLEEGFKQEVRKKQQCQTRRESLCRSYHKEIKDSVYGW